jgi:hypothetical protein
VVFDGVVELLVFLGAREFAVKEEVADFKVVRMFGQLLNRVAAVQENAVCSVDVGNGVDTNPGSYVKTPSWTRPRTSITSGPTVPE